MRIVATTNVDSIYEDYVTSVAGVGAYATVFNHEGRLVHALRTEGRLVVKIHGCVSRVEKVVFNREQYFSAKRNYPEFYAGLGALFLTNALLFIGSGFNGDPDLDLLLQDSLIAGSDATPYYAILEAGRPAAVHRAMERSFNVKFLEYEGGQYNQVAASLGELVDLVQEYRTLHP